MTISQIPARTRPSLRTRLRTTLSPMRIARKLRRDEDGIAAIEFAIIAPLMIAMYLGLAEISMAMSADRRVSHSAAVTGDLVAQYETVDMTTAAEIMSAGMRVANVQTPADYTVHIESWRKMPDDSLESQGSVSFNDGKKGLLPAVNVASLEEFVLSEQSGVVVARVAYSYRPFGFKNTLNNNQGFLPSTVVLKDVFLLKPRETQILEIGTDEKSRITCLGSMDAVSCSETKLPAANEGDDD